MQKESIAWLIIRTIGLLFLCAFAIKFYSFLTGLAFIYNIYQPISDATGDTLRLVNVDWRPIFDVISYAALSIYFLKHGQLAHRWLLRE